MVGFMVKKLRMGQILNNLWLILVLFALGGFLCWKMGPGLFDLLKGPKRLTSESNLESMEGKYVSWEVKYPVDEYIETTKTTKINGVSTGTKKKSSSWLVIDYDRGICLSVEVPVKRFEEMDAQADIFYEFLEQETEMELDVDGIVVAGTLEVLEGEELSYFKQLASYAGLPVEAKVYHIGDGVIKGESKTNIYGLMAIGVFILLMGIFILVKTLKNSAGKLVDKYLESHPGITMERLESDFASAQEVSKVWVGKNWTFSAKLDELLFDNRQVVWVHTGSVRRGRNVNFYVWWYMIDGSEESVSLSSEKKCKAVMEKYNQFSHMLVGNNPEYGYMLQNDREAFLNMKYRSSGMEENMG